MSIKKRQFVKYTNRKIYDLEASAYVSMEDLAEIASAGVIIQVTDDRTKEDLTVFTLARMVYERARTDHKAYKASELQDLLVRSTPTKKVA